MKQHYTILAILISLSSFGQRLAYVDTHKILNAIPEYQQSQLEINRLSKNWENEITRIFQMANELSVALEAEKVLLTPDMIKDRGVTIKSMNDSARAKQMRYFGSTGSLFSKREEMVAPLQALIAGAIKEIARKKKLDFVFDKGSSVSVVYANESNDITSDVLRQLGY
jgi:outer membrane protein